MSAAKDNADVSPLFIEIRPGMRKALADAVEAFLNLLDQIDADADLEDADAPEDDVPCEDVGDDELSLGGLGGTALGGYFNQAGWAQGASDDREDEHDGCEPGGDDEPTLGATTAINQGHAWRANADAWGSCDEAEPSLGWGGVGCGHPEMALRGYDDDSGEDYRAARRRRRRQRQRRAGRRLDGFLVQSAVPARQQWHGAETRPMTDLSNVKARPCVRLGASSKAQSDAPLRRTICGEG